MLLVRAVSGPTAATVGNVATYRVTTFSERDPDIAASSQVSWLVKSADGASLGSFSRHGPELRLSIPDSWAGQVATIMPFMNSPSANVAVRTAIAELAAPRPTGSPRTVRVVREQNRFYASANDEPRFYLGSDVRYGQRRGLMNTSNPPGPRYRVEDHAQQHGDWAWYLLPTIICESNGHFCCLNTYDRAAFTFGHIQLAAHTPQDNFVLFLRQALQRPTAADHFPDLAVHDGRVHRRTRTDSLVPLETPQSTAALMQYFNPSPGSVDDQETERAARMVDWTLRDPGMRDLQVAFSVHEQKRKLRIHATKLPLHGLADKLCIAVLDILHQGRGKYVTIANALRAADPFDALLGIGGSQYASRVATLRAGIRDLEAAGKVGRKVYDARSNSFIVPGEV